MKGSLLQTGELFLGRETKAGYEAATKNKQTPVPDTSETDLKGYQSSYGTI